MRQPTVAGQLRRAGCNCAARFAQRVLEIPGLGQQQTPLDKGSGLGGGFGITGLKLGE